MPVREKARRSPDSPAARPFSRPSVPQNAAKLRGFSRTVSAFTAETDCLLEESGFEPLVPPQGQHNRGTGPMSPRRRDARCSGSSGLEPGAADDVAHACGLITDLGENLARSGQDSAPILELCLGALAAARSAGPGIFPPRGRMDQDLACISQRG